MGGWRSRTEVPSPPKSGLAAVVTLAVVCGITGTGSAHVGFALSSRIDLTGAWPRIEVWADLDHVRGNAENIRNGVVRSTFLTADEADCTRRDVAVDRPAARVLRTTITFACPGQPTHAILGAPRALGAGRAQWVEIVLPHETRARIVLSSEPIALDVRGSGVLRWIGLGTVLLLAAVAGLLFARGRGRRENLPGTVGG